MGDAARSPILLTTTTGELFLPSRIIYRVHDREELLRRLRLLRCMGFDEERHRWTWNYEFEAEKLGFPPAYDAVPPERRPLLLASCYEVEPDRLHAYVRSTLRLTKFLVFFDKHIPRRCAEGEFFDEYNLVTTIDDPGKGPVMPEDYFRDESKVVFEDLEASLDAAASDPAEKARLLARHEERCLQALERHRLAGFYEDGEEHMAGAMKLRELLAMKQSQSDKPIRPFEVILDMMKSLPETAEPCPTGFPATSKAVPSDSAGWARLSDEELAGMMFARGDQLPMEFAREAVSRGERLIPLLAEVARHECNWHRSDAGWCAVAHATYLLGAIGGGNVVEPLMDALRLAEEFDDSWVTEELPSIFGSLGPRVLEPLRAVALDPQADWMLRHTAMAGMAAVTIRRPEEHAGVFELIGRVAADEAEDEDLRAWAGEILLHFSRREHKALLLRLVKSGLAEGLYGKWDIRKGMLFPRVGKYRRDWLEFYRPELILERRRKWESGRMPEREAWAEVLSRPWGADPADDPCEDSDEAPDAPAGRPPHPGILMEQMSFNVSRRLADKEFASDREREEFLKSLRGKIDPPAPRNSREAAQDVMYEAWQENNRERRVAQAGRALALCSDCSDAYLLLAEETAASEAEYRQFLEKAVQAGERALGEARFKEDEGHFWAVVETRPYMRARAALADCLLEDGQTEAAIGHYRELLRLNPRDNQGNRYDLLAALGRLGRFEQAQDILDRPDYAQDRGLQWLCMKALVAFAREGPSAQAERLLQAVLASNPHVPDYLLGRKPLPEDPPRDVAAGRPEEAMRCAMDFGDAWRRAPGALEWLGQRHAGASGAPGVQKIGRNEPCPCGSGKKFKKCCLDRPAGHA